MLGERENFMFVPKISNPIDDGYYADPESRFYEGKYWIYVTESKAFKDQKNLTVFSSSDMENWEKHENIVDMSDFPWIWGAVWAPTVIEKNGKYYLIFASNDIHSDEDDGGLEIAWSDSPAGPFKSLLGKTLVSDIYNNAQPIDAHLFKDDDGIIYLYYGGWGHCIVAIMNDDMTGLKPFSDGTYRKEITPESYVEGPCMIKRGNDYYLLWSSGKWNKNDYCVYYGRSKSPLGPFEKEGTVLISDETIARAPGHNGFFYIPQSDEYFITYHRRSILDTERDARKICIDRMIFDGNKIKTVKMT